MRCIPLSSFVLFLIAGAALAAPPSTSPPSVVAEQAQVQLSGSTEIGGGAQLRFAQVFQLPREGYLSHVMLPVNCSRATAMQVWIGLAVGGVPTGVVVATEDMRSASLDAHVQARTVGMRMIEFTQPALLPAGEYAFTLIVPAGRRGVHCTLWLGPSGDTYTGGRAFFNERGNMPRWSELLDTTGAPRDLAFQVFVRPL
ncbi:hypothetical protein [Pseudoxanthomonas sp. PXM02]|uniref:hypothetical protein n=1 Tax=Pseudoxanthomonas sp. PXM02 TaxID=2769294 RepID=UPI00177BCC94|nr:hypothetical protein [Pseudoxanthomonas sp. PXM02]MBD9480364.1 hypothetical protein [Pseudoxanthomonas sp. PXM02]